MSFPAWWMLDHFDDVERPDDEPGASGELGPTHVSVLLLQEMNRPPWADEIDRAKREARQVAA